MADIGATQTNNTDDWETPWWFVHLLEQEIGGPFDLDPACTETSKKAVNYFDESANGLLQPWFGFTYCNPPYSQAAEWVKKAYTEAFKGNATVYFLCAARPDTRYWWNYTRHGEVRFIKGRLRFVGAKNSAPFPSALVVFHKNMSRTPSTVYWEIFKEDRE